MQPRTIEYSIVSIAVTRTRSMSQEIGFGDFVVLFIYLIVVQIVGISDAIQSDLIEPYQLGLDCLDFQIANNYKYSLRLL